MAQAKIVVGGGVKRRYPFIEEIDGRVYVDTAGSARDAALLILWHIYPKRMDEESLRNQLVRHLYSKANANMAIVRIQGAVDNDHGFLKLSAVGIREAEDLIGKAEKEH